MTPKTTVPCLSTALSPDSPIRVWTDTMPSLKINRAMHCHDCVSILYIIKPGVSMRTVDQIVTPQAGDFLFLLPHTPHAMLKENAAGHHIDIYIAEDYFYQNIFPQLCDNPVFMNFFFIHIMPEQEQPYKLLSVSDSESIKENMAAIRQEYLCHDNLFISIMSSQIVILLALLARTCQENAREERCYHAKADRIVSYISSHFLTVTLADAAWHFHYTPNYVSQSLRAETGKSFTEWLHLFRINHAKTLLARTDLPAATVATACGFENPKYFYRIFKRLAGVTPSEYRRQSPQ